MASMQCFGRENIVDRNKGAEPSALPREFKQLFWSGQAQRDEMRALGEALTD